MNQFLSQAVLLFLLSSAGSAIAKLTPDQAEQLPPPASHQVDFKKEIQPVLETRCVNCHGRGRAKGGLRLDTRATLLQGGDSGPAVVLGKSGESLLIELVSGLDPDNIMPQKGTKLTREQVSALRAWIDQGLVWDERTTFGRVPPRNLQPPQSPLPVGEAALRSVNGIDLLLKAYYHRQHLTPPAPVSDRVFARRVYLDVIGLLPSPGELESFLADGDPGKRERLVRQLLGDHQGYAQHWLTFWNDLLRNDYKGTGYIDEGRKQITDWLYRALAHNLPFDRFVSQLIDPVPGAEGFVKGILWRGVVNASQTPEMQAAQNISQVFMGVNLKCASCHDSFINDWTLADAYGLASIYAESELEMVLCDKPTGKKATMKFLYPELGSLDPSASKADRQKRLAEIITDQRNGRLARTVVNRLWAKLMGRGLVEPLDDMEQPSWNPELLDWLAADLVANRYDLKKTLERILTSEAYQAPSVPAVEVAAKDYVFRGPLVRRLSAEQFQDALAEVTGVWHPLPAYTQADFAAGATDYPLSEVENPARLLWIWNHGGASSKAPPGTVYFRKTVTLAGKPSHAVAVIACDNSFKLYVNGKEAGSGQDHNKPNVIDLAAHMQAGDNLVAIAAVNRPAAPDNKEAEQANPAGLLCYFRVREEVPTSGPPVVRIEDFGSNEGWLCSTNKTEGWEKPETRVQGWEPAVELGIVGISPWKLEKKFAQALSAASLAGHVRASLVAADPLMTALGRPNREQVMTTRASAATTLQALEMTNGKTLAEHLKRGSEKLVQPAPASSKQFVSDLFARALTRPPAPDELELAVELIGSPVKREGVEDLLWAVAMLPEFQLIY